MADFWIMREAICSTALSHDEACNCRVCMAANGNDDAMRDLIIDLMTEGR